MIVIEYLTMTQMVDWLNEVFGVKESGKPFNIQDVQQYVHKFQRLPRYLGDYKIERHSDRENMKLYKIIKGEV